MIVNQVCDKDMFRGYYNTYALLRNLAEFSHPLVISVSESGVVSAIMGVLCVYSAVNSLQRGNAKVYADEEYLK